MPLYRCHVAPGLTSQGQRALVAKELTRIHCEVTGAPPSFVHVFFQEDTHGRLPAGAKVFVLGSIRAGRTPEQKSRLVSEMRRATATATGVREDEVSVVTADLPARWVMEGGAVLPEPGEEEAWLAEHR